MPEKVITQCKMGCGPMIFQMIFLMGVIGIIYYPIQYVLGASGFNDASNEIYKVDFADLPANHR